MFPNVVDFFANATGKLPGSPAPSEAPMESDEGEKGRLERQLGRVCSVQLMLLGGVFPRPDLLVCVDHFRAPFV
jgi:hypothetical protein